MVRSFSIEILNSTLIEVCWTQPAHGLVTSYSVLVTSLWMTAAKQEHTVGYESRRQCLVVVLMHEAIDQRRVLTIRAQNERHTGVTLTVQFTVHASSRKRCLLPVTTQLTAMQLLH